MQRHDLLRGGRDPPATWEELAATAATLSGDSRFGLVISAVEGIEGATAYIIRLLAAGGEVTDVDSEAGQAALQQFVDMVEAGSMSPGILGWIEDDVATQFSTEQAAMMINSATTSTSSAERFPIGLVTGAAGRRRARHVPQRENLTITTGAQNPDAAWDLMLWLQQPEVLNEYLPERNKPARPAQRCRRAAVGRRPGLERLHRATRQRLGSNGRGRHQIGRNLHLHPGSGAGRHQRRQHGRGSPGRDARPDRWGDGRLGVGRRTVLQ